jgi:hypothetical protein
MPLLELSRERLWGHSNIGIKNLRLAERETAGGFYKGFAEAGWAALKGGRGGTM